MAQLKDLLVLGPSRFIGDVFANNLQAFRVTDNLIPIETNTYSLGSSDLRWKSLFIGTADTYGSASLPIWWNNGVPQAITSYSGVAASANKLNTNAGSTTLPIYFVNGVPANTTYALNATIDSGAANRMAYYSETNKISLASAIYASKNSMTINGTSAPAEISARTVRFLVNGAAAVTGDLLVGLSASLTTEQASGFGCVINKDTKIKGRLNIEREGTTSEDASTLINLVNYDSTTLKTSTSLIIAHNNHGSPALSNMVINSDGNLVIGSGMSGNNLYAAKKSSWTGITKEELFVVSDEVINVEANANTIANRIGFLVTTAGHIIPVKAEAANNNALDIGTSNNKWANVYATTIKVNRINEVLVGTGTAGSSTANSTPSEWIFNAGLNSLVDGDIVTIKIPAAGSTNGIWLSVDNGTKYYPICNSLTGRLTTHFAVGEYITVIFDSDGSAASVAPRGGGTLTTQNGGVWHVINFYNTNTDTLLRVYSSPTNIDVPLIGQSSAKSTTAAWTTYTGTYKDWYGVIPNDDSKRAKINLSTGTITVPGGIVGDLTGNASTATKLATARNLTVALGSTTAVTFDGSANLNSIPVSGTLGIAHGGTGVTTADNVFSDLSWIDGITTGPTLSITIVGKNRTAIIPSATKNTSGIVTAGNQTFGGRKGFGQMDHFAFDGNSAELYIMHRFYNNAGTQVGSFFYNIGNKTNISKGQYAWRSYSPQSTATTSTTGYYETFYLPNVTSGLTANVSYNILTTKTVTNNTTATAYATDTNIPTMNTLYYGSASINGARQTSNVSIYAPTDGGTSGLVLKSNGNSAPTWQAETTYTLTTTGSGNAVTGVSLSGTTFTVTKGNAGLTGTVTVSQGGTGLTSFTTNKIYYASASTTLTASNHSIDNDQMAINTTIQTGYALYVNGAFTATTLILPTSASSTNNAIWIGS